MSSPSSAVSDSAAAPPEPMRAAERERLRAALTALNLRLAALLLVLLLLALGVSWRLGLGPAIAFDSRGRVEISLLILAGWCYGLRHAPARWRAARADLAQGRIAVIEGRAHLSERRSFGLIGLARPTLEIGTLRFDLPAALRPSLIAADRVRLRYAPGATVLLAVEALSDHPSATRPEPVPAVVSLSAREQALLGLLAQGLSDKLIARELGLTPATVRTYNSTLFQKLAAGSRREAVERAVALGLLDVN